MGSMPDTTSGARSLLGLDKMYWPVAGQSSRRSTANEPKQPSETDPNPQSGSTIHTVERTRVLASKSAANPGSGCRADSAALTYSRPSLFSGGERQNRNSGDRNPQLAFEPEVWRRHSRSRAR